MLLSVLVDAEAFEVDVSSWAKLWLDRAGLEDRGLHAQRLHAVLHYGELYGDDACHLNRTAKRDLAVSL